MTNPIYADDPDFYERPGEVVHLITDVHPTTVTVPAMPWDDADPAVPRSFHLAALGMERLTPVHPCIVCAKPTQGSERLCPYCQRAQYRDETHRARARQPQPTTPRVHVREGWEQWASEQGRSEPEGPTIREHETRIG